DLTIKDYEFTVGQDLFPKDFIINIPAPSNYIGPDKVFGLSGLSSNDLTKKPLPLIRLVNDNDPITGKNPMDREGKLAIGKENELSTPKSLVPDKHKKTDPLPEELPNSLKLAIKCFILSASARRVRNQIDVHNSM